MQDLIDQLRDLIPTLRNLGETAGSASGDRGTDRIIAALGKLNATMSQNIKTKDAERRAMEAFTKEVDKAADAQEEYRKKQKEAADTIAKAAAEQAEAARRAAMSDEELAEERRQQHKKNLKSEYENLREKRSQNVNYAALLAREQLEQRKANTTFRSGLERLAGDSVAAQRSVLMLSSALDTVGKLGMSMGKFAGELAQGNTKFTTLNPLIDSVSEALGKIAEAIPFAGSAISGSMKLVAEGTKFIINQLQTTTETFQELGQTGALTAEGMSGVQKQFLESGLTLGGYKKAVIENAATLARFGGTVGDGTKKFTKFVGNIVDSRAGDELRRLGFAADDIGETAGAFLNQQTRLGMAQNKTQSQLTQGAVQYAKELDTLTRLTGMNRKEIQAQQDAALSEGRFRAQTDEMIASGNEKGAKALLDFQTQVARISPELGAAIRDTATGFTNSEAAIKGFNSTSGQIGPIIEALKRGEIDQGEAMRRLQAATKDAEANQRTFAKAAGDGQDVFVKYAELSDFNRAQIEGNAIKAKQAQDAAVAGQDDLTNKTVDAQKSMEQMSRQIQNFGFAVMPKAADAVQQFTGALNEFVKGVAKATGIELPAITQNGKALASSMNETKTAVDQAKTAIDLALDPKSVLSQQAAKKAALDKQDDENWKKATLTEKASVAMAKTVENLGDALGDLISWSGLESVGGRIKGAAGAARESRVAEDTAYLRQQGRLPSAPGAAPAPGAARASQQDLASMGLKIKQGDVQASGATVSPKLIEMAKQIQSSVPGFGYFSGFNDRFHQENSPASKHTSGLAADFTVTKPPTPKEAEGIISTLKSLGASKVIDEYNNPSSKATGGHFHVEVPGFARGGITQGPSIAGEKGPEAVVPLPDGRTIPVNIKSSGMESAVERLNDAVKLFSNAMGPTFAGYNKYTGYNAGPLTTDLKTLSTIAERLGAFDSATQTITDTKTWDKILQSGIATNYNVAGIDIGSKMLPEIKNLLAQEIGDLVGQGASVDTAVQKVGAEFKAVMKDWIDQQQSLSGNDVLVQQLVELANLARQSNNTQSRILQVSSN